MTENTNTENATVAAVASPEASVDANTAPAVTGAVAPTPTLIERAENIVSSLEGLAYHDAVSVMHYVAERLSGVEREGSIVKTKFEEAIMWIRRHIERKAVDAAAAATPAATTAAE